MLTRCPHCATTFRVRPEQLRIRQGRVRCGHCSQPFNALESLLEDEATRKALAEPQGDEQKTTASAPIDGPPVAIVPEPQVGDVGEAQTAEAPEHPALAEEEGAGEPEDSGGPLFVLEDTMGEEQEQLAIPDIDEAVPELYIEGLSRDPKIIAAPDWSLPDLDTRGQPPAAPPAARPELGIATDEATRDASASLDFDLPSNPAAMASSAVPAGEIPEPVGESGSVDQPASDQARPEIPEPDPWGERRVAEDIAGTSAAPIPRSAAETAAAAARHDIAGSPALAKAPDTPPPAAKGFESAAEEYPFRIAAPKPQRNGLWGLGIGTLLMLLVAQSALLYRHAIVQIWPETQPIYIDLCGKLGCDMPLPREAGFIAIEATDLHPEPARPDTFVLRTTIHNRAAFRQALPHLELTLTDARDNALSRRVLTPEEWRPSQAGGEGFAASSLLDVSVPFEAPGLKAVGYRVYAFYP